MVSVRSKVLKNLIYADDVAISSDALALFTKQNEGHMGKWEYGPSLYHGDPAGGADLWSEMVRRPGYYYVTKSDIALIKWAIRQELFQNYFKNINTFIELGPGSEDIVRQKTIPLIKSISSLTTYVALDISKDFAEKTAKVATKDLDVKAKGIAHDFSKPFLENSKGNSGFVLLGSTISNLECKAGENPFHKLSSLFKHLRTGMASGDVFMTTFDMGKGADRVLRGYRGKAAKRHGINLVHRLKRDGVVTGDFNPHAWQYEPVWISSTSQCCHTVYPVINQTIRAQGFEIRIPAYSSFVLNNSYKYKPEFVIWAAQTAGFHDCYTIIHENMAMLFARA